MRVEFAYDLDKDVENFAKTLNSVNNKEHTAFHRLYIEKRGQDFKPDLVKKFIKEHTINIDIPAVIAEIENNWLPIHEKFIERAEKIFGIKYPLEKITAYLTTNNRCSYNTKENYFFVYLKNKSSNRTIMHEIFHFYTWHLFYKKLFDQGVSKEKYNDIKESLTELLNLEFSDLLDGAVDYGYQRHQEMRAKVRDMWNSDKNLHKIINVLIK
ncbi:MAG: hypothetical protein Q7R69_02600 [bacterium]|nr:hypothetical protein [bacterium]